jgi:hypothetical protein
MTRRIEGFRHVGTIAENLVREIGERSGFEPRATPDPLDRGGVHQRVFRKGRHAKPPV